MRACPSLLLLVLLPFLPGCGGEAPQTPSAPAQAPLAGMAEARQALAGGDLKLRAGGQPPAVITPAGDFLVDGQPVAVSEHQRVLLQEYRERTLDMATRGMAMGREGARLGLKAAGHALRSLLRGEPEAAEAAIAGEADGLRRQARDLCAQVPDLLAVRRELAQTLPAFAPYADHDDGSFDATECGDGDLDREAGLASSGSTPR